MKFRGRAAAPEPGFQLAPMIDVIFLLLCFFVSSQIFSQWETEIDIKLPTAQTGTLPNRLPGEIIVNISADGAIIVNSQTLAGDELLNLLRRIVGLLEGERQPVLIRADKATPYEYVVRVLDLCRQADVWNISFATSVSEPNVSP